MVGDLAGFVAATFNRGLPLAHGADHAAGHGRQFRRRQVGINHPQAKNLIGAFHQPAGVWIDTDVLDTLPDREYRSGLAEVVKYGVILDADFFAYLEATRRAISAARPDVLRPSSIARCCRLKADVVEQDEREETGLRAILNYGHTFAHAFETVGGYGTWLHGEAVAAGMICASRLAEKQVLDWHARITRPASRICCERFGLPIAPEPNWPADDLLASMYRDKKTQAGSSASCSRPASATCRQFVLLPETQVLKALKWLDELQSPTMAAFIRDRLIYVKAVTISDLVSLVHQHRHPAVSPNTPKASRSGPIIWPFYSAAKLIDEGRGQRSSTTIPFCGNISLSSSITPARFWTPTVLRRFDALTLYTDVVFAVSRQFLDLDGRFHWRCFGLASAG